MVAWSLSVVIAVLAEVQCLVAFALPVCVAEVETLLCLRFRSEEILSSVDLQLRYP